MSSDLDLAKELHTLMLKDLIKKIKGGTATASDLGVARALCKDSNVQALAAQGSPMGDLAASLPFAGEPDSYQSH